MPKYNHGYYSPIHRWESARERQIETEKLTNLFAICPKKLSIFVWNFWNHFRYLYLYLYLYRMRNRKTEKNNIKTMSKTQQWFVQCTHRRINFVFFCWNNAMLYITYCRYKLQIYTYLDVFPLLLISPSCVCAHFYLNCCSCMFACTVSRWVILMFFRSEFFYCSLIN